MNVLVLNGPNLNMLGIREPGIYGTQTYDDLEDICHEAGADSGFETVGVFQSNHEGDLVDAIQEARGEMCIRDSARGARPRHRLHEPARARRLKRIRQEPHGAPAPRLLRGQLPGPHARRPPQPGHVG